MSNPNRCIGKVYDSTGFHTWLCEKTGKFDRGGHRFCGMHDPVSIADRRARRGPSRFDLELQAMQKQQENLRRLVVAARNYRDQPGVKERQADLTAALLPYERIK